MSDAVPVADAKDAASAERDDYEARLAKQADELARANALLERYLTALRTSNVTVYAQDLELRYTAISNPVLGRSVEEIIGRTDHEILPAATADVVVALKKEVLESGAAREREIVIGSDAGQRWFDLNVEPLRDPLGRITGVTGAAVDVTTRKQGEARLRLLMRELTHRSKNLLAVIQAMARQTARYAGSISAFLDRFGARLQALSASHDILVKESWHGASLREVITAQLAHHLATPGRNQLTIDGPDAVLKPEAAQSLGLALHELSVNASKYGALSQPEGRVRVEWRRLSADQGHGIELIWEESGGPPAKSPKRRGFGTLVIEKNLSRAVDAEVDLSFPREGVRCRVVLPITQMLPAR